MLSVITFFTLNTRNMFHRCTNELPRANNHVEGWNTLKHVLSYHSLVEAEIAQALGGQPAPPRRYADSAATIFNIVESR